MARTPTPRRRTRKRPTVPLKDNTPTRPEGQRPCPICGRHMTTTRRQYLSVDVCTDHGVWLDQGELEKMFQSYRRQTYDKTLRNHRKACDRGSRDAGHMDLMSLFIGD